MSDNNDEQYLVSYFCKLVAFLRVFLFIKELAHSIVVYTFFY